MNLKLDLITLFVNGMETMVAFYRDATGFKVTLYELGSPFAESETGSVSI